MSATQNPPHWAKWRGLLGWDPFKIDALGLVTLLGADEINGAAGRLVRSRWLEYLPFLGAFVIANESFREKQAGYNLYNITQGIHTTDMAPWFSRWMKSQDFETTSSFVRWTITPPRNKRLEDFAGMTFGFCSIGFLIAMTIISYDWYGFANAMAMATSVFVRTYMLWSIRESIDRRVEQCIELASKIKKPEELPTLDSALRNWGSKSKDPRALRKDEKSLEEGTGSEDSKEHEYCPHQLEFGWNGSSPAKVLFVTADARTVTMIIPTELLPPPSPFIANLGVPNKFFYELARWSGWLAFAVQVITLGQAVLSTQIYTVVLMVAPTVLYVMKFGCDDSPWWANTKKYFRGIFGHASTKSPRATQREWTQFEPVSESWIGSRLKAEVYYWPWSHEIAEKEGGGFLSPGDEGLDPRKRERGQRRQHLYAWLQLTKPEQESMDKWDLFPHERGNNKEWMEKYEKFRLHIEKIQAETGGIKSIKPTPSIPSTDPPAQAAVPATSPAQASTVGQAPSRSATGQTQAQDGSDLDPNAKSEDPIEDEDEPPVASPASKEPQSATTSRPPELVTDLRAPARSNTEPASPHRHRRASMTSPVVSSANWMTRFTQEGPSRSHQEES